MLNAEKFYVHSNAVKVEKGLDFYELTRSLVRNTELSNALNKSAYKDNKEVLESAHVGCNVLTLEEEVIYTTLKEDAGDFIKARKEVIDLKEEVEKCRPIEEVTSLCLTDRMHITLMAHAIYKNVLLDDDIFDIEKGGVDISGVIAKYYTNGGLKDVKNALRPIFNKLLGTEGDYFYAIKTKKSDFGDREIRHFLATFGGSAKRESTKKNNNIIFGKYDYTDKSGNKKVQLSAFTTLCAVVLDNADKHEVIKLEETKEETK